DLLAELADGRVAHDEPLAQARGLGLRVRALHRLLGLEERGVVLDRALRLLELGAEQRDLRLAARALGEELLVLLVELAPERGLRLAQVAELRGVLDALLGERGARVAQALALAVRGARVVRPEWEALRVEELLEGG